jgi:hypothetical protein
MGNIVILIIFVIHIIDTRREVWSSVQVGANAKLNLKIITKQFLALLTHEFLDKFQLKFKRKTKRSVLH